MPKLETTISNVSCLRLSALIRCLIYLFLIFIDSEHLLFRMSFVGNFKYWRLSNPDEILFGVFNKGETADIFKITNLIEMKTSATELWSSKLSDTPYLRLDLDSEFTELDCALVKVPIFVCNDHYFDGVAAVLYRIGMNGIFAIRDQCSNGLISMVDPKSFPLFEGNDSLLPSLSAKCGTDGSLQKQFENVKFRNYIAEQFYRCLRTGKGRIPVRFSLRCSLDDFYSLFSSIDISLLCSRQVAVRKCSVMGSNGVIRSDHMAKDVIIIQISSCRLLFEKLGEKFYHVGLPFSNSDKNIDSIDLPFAAIPLTDSCIKFYFDINADVLSVSAPSFVITQKELLGEADTRVQQMTCYISRLTNKVFTDIDEKQYICILVEENYTDFVDTRRRGVFQSCFVAWMLWNNHLNLQGNIFL